MNKFFKKIVVFFIAISFFYVWIFLNTYYSETQPKAAYKHSIYKTTISKTALYSDFLLIEEHKREEKLEFILISFVSLLIVGAFSAISRMSVGYLKLNPKEKKDYE